MSSAGTFRARAAAASDAGVLDVFQSPPGMMPPVTQREQAVEVWQAARGAQGAQLSPERVQRVRGKLSDPRSLLVVMDREGVAVGMALAEPFRTANGFGTVQPGHGHLSMVFVRPDTQGRGIGTELVQRIIADAPWTILSLWTHGRFIPVDGLRRLGFRATSDRRTTVHGLASQRWERVGA